MNAKLKDFFLLVLLGLVLSFVPSSALIRSLVYRIKHPAGNSRSIHIELESFLNNYRAQENQWPFSLEDLNSDPNQKNIYTVSGESNAVVFAKIFQSEKYVDRSRIMTCVNGKYMTVEKALKKGYELIPVGYMDTKNKKFLYFSVIYNSSTDSVKVSLDH